MEKLMYHVSLSYLRNSEDAADAVQDALTKAWEKRKVLAEPGKFRPWLMRILVNRCKDMLRRRSLRSYSPLTEHTASTEMPGPQPPVMEAVCALKPELRTVVVLHYVDGYSVQEMAGTLGIPEGTIKTRLRRARKRLEQTLLVEWEEEK